MSLSPINMLYRTVSRQFSTVARGFSKMLETSLDETLKFAFAHEN